MGNSIVTAACRPYKHYLDKGLHGTYTRYGKIAGLMVLWKLYVKGEGFLSDDAVKITSELYDPNAKKSHLCNKKREYLTESTGVAPTEYPPKVKLELFSQL